MNKRRIEIPKVNNDNALKKFTSETKENRKLEYKKRQIQYENSLLGTIIF